MSDPALTTTGGVTRCDGTDEHRGTPRMNVIAGGLTLVDIVPGATGGLMVNLSTSGMAIQSIAQQRIGDRKKLRWRFSANTPWLEVDAEVAWCDRFNMSGLRFLGPSVEAQRCIEGWLKREPGLCGTDAGIPESEPAPVEPAYSPRLKAQDLQLLVKEAQELAGAAGAAIVIGAELIVTEQTTPEMRTTLLALADSRLSAECLGNRLPVCCSDTNDDPRMNAEVCQQMGMRSAVLVPITGDGGATGVLECAFTQTRAYCDEDVQKLCSIAETIEALLRPEQTAETEDYLGATIAQAEPRPVSVSASEARPLVPGVTGQSTFEFTAVFGNARPVRPLFIAIVVLLFLLLGIGCYLWHEGRVNLKIPHYFAQDRQKAMMTARHLTESQDRICQYSSLW